MESTTNNKDSTNLNRGLSNRHVQLITIGGAIGTGLFMGSGKTISLAGPSVVIVYAIIGFMLFFVMRAMGELLLSNLRYKSFVDFAFHLLGPSAGFYVGWTYWLCWIVTGVADVVAIVGYTQFWWPELNRWIPVIACIVIFLVLNLLTVKLFGELEFWFAIIKVIAIIALILVGIYMVSVSTILPDGVHYASLANFWNNGDLFPNKLMGFFAGFQIATFAFVGIELAGTAAAEIKDPEKNLPRAINSVPIRVILFYILSLIVIMCVIPYAKISPNKSPFVELFVLVGIPIAAGLVNFVVLTSAASSANSGIFSTSRMLYGLAKQEGAPKIFGKLSRFHVPANGLMFSCLCVVLAYALLSNARTIMTAFTVVTTVSAILFIFIWSMILISYVVYRLKYDDLHQKSIYKMPGGLFMCAVVLCFFAFILVILSLKADTRIGLICTPIWFVLLTVFYFYIKKKGNRTSSI